MTIFNFWLYVPLFCLCCGLLAFVGKRKHLLNVLGGICILCCFFLLLLLVSELWLWLSLFLSFVAMAVMILGVLMF